MATHDTRTDRCVPDPVASSLFEVAIASELAVIVDVDALERSQHARVDHVMLALDALVYARIQVVLLSTARSERAEWLHQQLRESWHFEDTEPMFAIADVRTRMPGVRIIAATDQPSVCSALASSDRGLLLSGGAMLSISNSMVIGDVGLRAVLWWLVDERTRHAKRSP